MRGSAVELVQILQDAGYEAYWAGGCVRDMLLGVEPKDFDIATNARPEELKKLLNKTIPIGEAFGVILAEHGDQHFEIATFRSDSGYSDGRRPDAVLFTTAEEDAQRRDFTINGLFYDPIADKVLDFVSGQKDLDNRLIRFIGEPHERILEDHLRILRAVRFKNTLGFQYHPETFGALKKHANLAGNVSSERIRDELNKMIVHPSFPDALEDMEDTGVLAEILPEVQEMKGFAQPLQYHTEGDLWDHTILAIKALKPDAPLNLRWAVFLHDVGKTRTYDDTKERIRFDHHAEVSAEIAGVILRRLSFSRKRIHDICWLIEHHMSVYNVFEMEVGRRRHWFLQQLFLELLELNRCDTLGTIPADLTQHGKVLELYREDLASMPREPDRLLTGEDVMEILSLKPGPRIQEVLDAVRFEQLAGRLSERDEAENWVRREFEE